MAAFFSARSTSGLSSVGGLCPPVAPAVHSASVWHLVGAPTAPAGRRRKPVRRTFDALAKPKALNASAKVRTDTAGLRRNIRLHPSMQTISIKPAAGACSLGQDAFPKSRSPSLFRSDARRGMSVRTEFLTTCFPKSVRRRADKWAGTPRRAVSRLFGGRLARGFEQPAESSEASRKVPADDDAE